VSAVGSRAATNPIRAEPDRRSPLGACALVATVLVGSLLVVRMSGSPFA
jgi:hypothetical protein